MSIGTIPHPPEPPVSKSRMPAINTVTVGAAQMANRRHSLNTS